MPYAYASVEVEIRVSGYRKAIDALHKMGNGTFTNQYFSDYIPFMLNYAREYATRVTHVMTGHLAQSHMWEYNSRHMVGRIFINPRDVYTTSVGANTLRWPHQYGVYEHARGYPHDFYKQTADHIKLTVVPEGMKFVARSMERLWR